MMPKVSVLMSVYNGERYLRQAVESILAQTFADFEFIIIDDCSNDLSGSIINSYSDPRIVSVRNEINLGLTGSLNAGLEIVRGEYIARMDCDDVSLPERLGKQVSFMDSHPEVGVCGAWAKDIDEAGRVIADRPTRIGELADYYYWIPSPVIHPSAMIRAALLKRLRYDHNLRYAQDYDLWLRIVKTGYKLASMPEHLLQYRVHAGSISKSKLDTQLRLSYESFCKHITPQKISYQDYLAFFRGQYDLNPLRRGIITFKLSRSIKKPYRFYFKDNLRYTKMWLPVGLRSVTNATPGLNIVRKAGRLVKLTLLRFSRGVRGERKINSNT